MSEWDLTWLWCFFRYWEDTDPKTTSSFMGKTLVCRYWLTVLRALHGIGMTLCEVNLRAVPTFNFNEIRCSTIILFCSFFWRIISCFIYIESSSNRSEFILMLLRRPAIFAHTYSSSRLSFNNKVSSIFGSLFFGSSTSSVSWISICIFGMICWEPLVGLFDFSLLREISPLRTLATGRSLANVWPSATIMRGVIVLLAQNYEWF